MKLFNLVQSRRFTNKIVLSDLLTQPANDVDEEELHQSLLKALNPEGIPWWRLPDDGYIHWFLTHHLSSAGQFGKLPGLLLEFEWIKAMLNITGPVALHEDYNAVQEDKTLRVVQEAIRLSIPVLAREPDQIGSQLIGRLQDYTIPAIRDLVQTIRLSPPETDIWLDPYPGALEGPR